MSEHHEIPRLGHHDASEGFDRTEPANGSIAYWVIGSVIIIVVTIAALQFYFEKVWNAAVQEKVLEAPTGQLSQQHNLEDWRLTHYEYADKSRTTVRIPLDRARALVLEDAAAGKTFYPAKPTEPKPETPPDAPKEAPKNQAANELKK